MLLSIAHAGVDFKFRRVLKPKEPPGGRLFWQAQWLSGAAILIVDI
jgi:hypothetical protein